MAARQACAFGASLDGLAKGCLDNDGPNGGDSAGRAGARQSRFPNPGLYCQDSALRVTTETSSAVTWLENPKRKGDVTILRPCAESG